MYIGSYTYLKIVTESALNGSAGINTVYTYTNITLHTTHLKFPRNNCSYDNYQSCTHHQNQYGKNCQGCMSSCETLHCAIYIPPLHVYHK